MRNVITPCLWFVDNAAEAAEFYTSVFPDSKIVHQMLSQDDWPGGKAGDVLLVEFELQGQAYQALNGGPNDPFNERVSLSVLCKDQTEVDRYWEELIADGGEPIMCGWLKDKYGVRWQIVPEAFFRMVKDTDLEKSRRVMQAMTQLVKLDVAKLTQAYQGKQ
ncbi:3-demethylubiquinone-9 3-methyltransferase [Roseimaritima multifibrata]|uniref:3-demethylubiquinone-9 3-methyltransferase n=1 Tax=Roseimaritima multifibrata TaxID=1930274 RepID=A0A517MI65_9BACT|nr:VOC family protein [Roseimaritima multifibrata]QDS94571.1 3-demethylubiquinone-9 3-methyltransferase [Roseimaritima multifibrata]